MYNGFTLTFDPHGLAIFCRLGWAAIGHGGVGLPDFLGALIRTHVVHAPRRLKEVEEAERQLRAADMPVAVLPGVKDLFQRTASQIELSPSGPTAPTVQQAVDWLSEAIGISK